MKKLLTFMITVLSSVLLTAKAQTNAPKGYANGSLILADNSKVNGFLKNDISKKASVTVLQADGSKQTYQGDQLVGVVIDSTKFICIKGDFFKLVCEGELSFLQKSSDASGKPVYVGTEALFVNGTPGKPGDYFLYNNSTKQLQLVTNKNITELTAQSFINCEAAISKAKESTGNIALLKDAVMIFNSRNK